MASNIEQPLFFQQRMNKGELVVKGLWPALAADKVR